MEVRVFAGSLISSQRGDLGKIVITLFLRSELELCRLWQIVHGLYFLCVNFRAKGGNSDTWHTVQLLSTELVHNKVIVRDLA